MKRLIELLGESRYIIIRKNLSSDGIQITATQGTKHVSEIISEQVMYSEKGNDCLISVIKKCLEELE